MSYGWHSGLACHSEPAAAAAEMCAGHLSLTGSAADYARCTGYAVASCPSAALGASCDATVNVRSYSSSAPTNTLHTWVLQGCEMRTDSPFVMSVTDGAVLSFLVIAVWVAAFFWRQAGRVVWTSDAEST